MTEIYLHIVARNDVYGGPPFASQTRLSCPASFPVHFVWGGLIFPFWRCTPYVGDDIVWEIGLGGEQEEDGEKYSEDSDME